ncbi:hypothetical protein ACFV2L_42240 [Streptomyces sp. NPDC059687]|uniref:NHL domain-containing protein n=1 Tax=Streptomyces sp. NPDC059687 TaxID=3346905 RepID=UPI00369729D7
MATISTIAGDGSDRRGFGGPAAGLDLRQAVPIAGGKSVLGDNHGIAVDAAGRIYVAAGAAGVVGRIAAPSSWSDQELAGGFGAPTGQLAWKATSATGPARLLLEPATVDGRSAVRFTGTDVAANTWLYAVPSVLAGARVDCCVGVRGSGTVYLGFYNGAEDVRTAPVVLTGSPQTLALTTTVSGAACQFQIRTPSAQPALDVTVFDAVVRQHQVTGATEQVAGVMNSIGYDDGLPAARSHLNHPHGVAVDAHGTVYIADTYNNRIRQVDPAGVLIGVAGDGRAGYSGDRTPAVHASLHHPHALAVDGAGTVYVADTYNNRIRMIPGDGTIRTLAGTGTAGYNGDGIRAERAQLNHPCGIAVDASGTVYIADTYNHRVRCIAADGRIRTVAGTGTPGRPVHSGAGDGGAAAAAALNTPHGIDVDDAGTLYIADTLNNVVRRVRDGRITTVAGSGSFGTTGRDGGPALSAALAGPFDVAVDRRSGDLYIVEGSQAVLRVTAPA